MLTFLGITALIFIVLFIGYVCFMAGFILFSIVYKPKWFDNTPIVDTKDYYDKSEFDK